MIPRKGYMVDSYYSELIIVLINYKISPAGDCHVFQKTGKKAGHVTCFLVILLGMVVKEKAVVK
jgi:hypothetical protein